MQKKIIVKDADGLKVAHVVVGAGAVEGTIEKLSWNDWYGVGATFEVVDYDEKTDVDEVKKKEVRNAKVFLASIEGLDLTNPITLRNVILKLAKIAGGN